MPYVREIAGGKFKSIFENNEDFDLARHDFFMKPRSGIARQAGSVAFSPEEEKMLRTYQRLQQLTDDAAIADRLVAENLISAHHVAQVPEAQFVSERAAALGIDEDTARDLHRRAVQAKLRAQMAAFALKGSVGSAHYWAGAMDTSLPELAEYVDAIPSYQDFFGSLDYCSCDVDQSIFGPSAYLVDLLRIVYSYIDTAAFNAGIPDGWHLRDRRPDIENIPLTPEMTADKTIVPYHQCDGTSGPERLSGQWLCADLPAATGPSPYRRCLGSPN